LAASRATHEARAAPRSSYRGWQSLALGNDLIELQIVPEIGGRVIQFTFAGWEFFWVNRQLAGKQPPASGLATDGGWLNYGGDKLWPAPQGWEGPNQWPGPPDAVLDGLPYKAERLPAKRGEAAVRLTSGKDQRSGIQFSRVIRTFNGTMHVSIKATMKNVDSKPRRWGIWAHTQLDGGKAAGGGHNPLLNAWCPINSKSHFPKGYNVIFGSQNNPSFQPNRARRLMRVQYQYQVGKIALDSDAGWVATVDGANGTVFVQRFRFEADHEYPDGASAEFWLNGLGRFSAWGKENIMTEDPVQNPYVFESELLSPLVKLNPGQSYTWCYDWFACTIGGDYPVINCSDVGVVAEPLVAKGSTRSLQLLGRFGVFVPGRLQAIFFDSKGGRLRTVDLQLPVSPLRAVVLNTATEIFAHADSVSLCVVGASGKQSGELATAPIQPH
jgi:hypothetical protein